MTIKDQYGIVFYSQIINGIKYNNCDFTNPNYYNLSLITCFDASETSQMIDDLNDCITNQCNSSDFYLSDSIENLHTMEYQYPNMVVDDTVTIPMTDLIELFQDWLTFIG